MFSSFRLNTISAASSVVVNKITATGGTIDYSYDPVNNLYYKHHIFNTSGAQSFIVSSITGTPKFDAWIVGGGGAGGGTITASTGGGGGGAGQVRSVTNQTPTVTTYNFTIGAGATGTTASGTQGSSTTAFGLTSAGGGGGGRNGLAGQSVTGGSGGGGGSSTTPTGGASGGTGAFSGGAGNGLTQPAGGGGGGSTAAGATGNNGNGGGAGTSINSGYLGYTPSLGTGGLGNVSLGQSVAYSTPAAGIGQGGSGAGTTNTTTFAGQTGGTGGVVVRFLETGVTSLSFLASANGIASCVWPTVQAGDVAFIFHTSGGSSSLPAAVVPTGFTQTQTTTGGTTFQTRAILGYRLCDGTESGTTITGMTFQSIGTMFLIVYRGNVPATKIMSPVAGATIQITDAVPTSRTLTMSGYTGPFLGLAFYGSSAAQTTGARTSSVTETREIAAGTNNFVKCFEGSPTVSFANSTISMTDSGTNILAQNFFFIR